MIDNKDDIIERLLSIRAESGLKSKDFAAKAGVDPGNYSSIENKKRSLGDRVMKDICRAFNVNVAWLKTGEGEKYLPPPPASGSTPSSDIVSMPREVFDQITRLTETVLSQQRTIEELSKKVTGIAVSA